MNKILYKILAGMDFTVWCNLLQWLNWLLRHILEVFVQDFRQSQKSGLSPIWCYGQYFLKCDVRLSLFAMVKFYKVSSRETGKTIFCEVL